MQHHTNLAEDNSYSAKERNVCWLVQQMERSLIEFESVRDKMKEGYQNLKQKCLRLCVELTISKNK